MKKIFLALFIYLNSQKSIYNYYLQPGLNKIKISFEIPNVYAAMIQFCLILATNRNRPFF